ncbi:MAG: Molybdenum cofactor guanylyltransferase [Pelotomaculum sp. PtaB.Bin104]|nr:MAG: Molybdenum cofactor guanylyltransferase [Pelotomaculum sp. PtaB.Bin104]
MVKATGVILSGGKSSRMGSDKAFINIGQKGMIESVASVLKEVCAEVIISGGDEETGRRLDLKVIDDLIPGRGPLSGIHASLRAASYENCLVVACDMPFITTELASLILWEVEGYDVAVPSHGIFLQPLFAVYGKSCLLVIENYLNSGKIKVADLFPLVKTNYVSEDKIALLADIDTVFFNVNTPRDVTKARQMAQKN